MRRSNRRKSEPYDLMPPLSVATAIFGYLTNGSDCLSDPTTIGPHPGAGCQSQSEVDRRNAPTTKPTDQPIDLAA
jgi:hypothetical protein